MKQTSSLTWRLNRRHTAPDVWRSGVCSIVDVLLRHEGDNVFEEYPYEIISIFPKGLTSQYDDLSSSDALVLVSVPLYHDSKPRTDRQRFVCRSKLMSLKKYNKTLRAVKLTSGPILFCYWQTCQSWHMCFVAGLKKASLKHWDHSGYGLSQWEKALLCNAFSHWPSPYSDWSLKQ